MFFSANVSKSCSISSVLRKLIAIVSEFIPLFLVLHHAYLFLHISILLYIYLYEDGPFPFCIFPDFGLMPTLTPCYTEWAHPVTVVVVIVVDVTGRRNNRLTETNLKCIYLFRSLVLHAIAICFTSDTNFDQYSTLFSLMIFSS